VFALTSLVVGQLVFVVVLFLMGIVCLFFPEERSVLRHKDRFLSTVKDFVRSGQYVWMVRSVGIVAFVMGSWSCGARYLTAGGTERGENRGQPEPAPAGCGETGDIHGGKRGKTGQSAPDKPACCRG